MPVTFRNKIYFTAGAEFDDVFTADTNLSAAQYYFVMPASTAGYVKLANGASDPAPLGVLQNAPTAGQPALVRLFGLTNLVVKTPSGCALAYGRFITASDVGQGAPQATETGTPIIGRWLDTGVAVSSSSTGKAFILSPGIGGCAVSAS